MPLEILIDQVPKRLAIGEQALRMTYMPIMLCEKVENLLVVMTLDTATTVSGRGLAWRRRYTKRWWSLVARFAFAPNWAWAQLLSSAFPTRFWGPLSALPNH